MTQQMRLDLLTGPKSGDARLVGRGAFTVGTWPGATWVLPPVESGVAGEVRIADGAQGLTITLDRGTASLDQRALAPGAPRPLTDGATLAIGGHTLRAVRIATPAATPEAAPTISTILADVTVAQGDSPLPDRSGEEWLAELTGRSVEARPAYDTLGRYRGDGGDGPDPLSAPILPDDWDAPVSEEQNALAQRDAGATALWVGRALDAADAPAERAVGPGTRAFLKGAGLVADELSPDTPAQMAALGEMLRLCLTAIQTFEQNQARAMVEMGRPAAPPTAHTRPDAVMLATGEDPQAALTALTHRIADLQAAQDRALAGARAFAAAARAALDPDTIRATARRPRAAWAEYTRRYAEGPLDEVALARALAPPRPEGEDT